VASCALSGCGDRFRGCDEEDFYDNRAIEEVERRVHGEDGIGDKEGCHDVVLAAMVKMVLQIFVCGSR
jgi:hypothetical protein